MSTGGSQTSQTTSFPSWLQQPVQDYLGYAGQVAQQPYQPYTQQRVADLAPTQTTAIRGLRDQAYGGPLSNAASGYVQNQLEGGGWNPFTQNVADRITTDATRGFFDANNQLLGRFRGANRNSSAYDSAQGMLEQNFARGLGDSLAPVYSQGYENAANRQSQAVGQAQGLLGQHSQDLQNLLQAGDIERRQQQSLLDSQFGDFQDWRNYPNQQLGVFGNALGAVTGAAPRTTTTQGPGADPISQGLGTMAIGRYLSQGK